MDEADVPIFIDVLLGENTNPTHTTLADLDQSGLADRLDVSPFVEALLST
ncbi:MAG: hypothetical protein JXQ75_22870 [Phycisphaerae bacterium]|nr:hypothetical protein [Phycisphaerae bacterium]